MFFVFIFLFSFICLIFLRKIGKKIHLVDKPGGRKYHEGQIPLVGGISIFLGIICYLTFTPSPIVHKGIFTLCITILLITGIIDDKVDLSYRIRIVIQIIVACLMIFGANISLHNLGEIIPFINLSLGPFTYPITIIAVISAINAFNMMDGMDGLLGCISIIILIAFSSLFYLNDQHALGFFACTLIPIILPYILVNLGFPLGQRRKVFMGDAGSMLIGFIVLWFLLNGSQTQHSFKPVTALWIIAIPLMDMSCVMLRRVKNGNSPFKPDRTHLHHICLKNGLTLKQTLAFVLILEVITICIGMLFEHFHVLESVSFICFILLFIAYFIVTGKLYRRQHNW